MADRTLPTVLTDGNKGMDYSVLVGRDPTGLARPLAVGADGSLGAAAAGGVSANSSGMYDGATAITPKFASVAVSASGANTIVAAVTSKKIRVLAVLLTANGTVNVKWRSATTDKTGLAYLVANAGFVLPFNPVGWFETAAGALLDLNLSAAIAVGGHITYVEVA